MFPLPPLEFEQLAERSRYMGLTDDERRLFFLRPTRLQVFWEDGHHREGKSSLFHMLQEIRINLGETLAEYIAWGILETTEVSIPTWHPWGNRHPWGVALEVRPNGVMTSFCGPQDGWDRGTLRRLLALQGWIRYSRVEEYRRWRALLGSNVIKNFEIFWVDHTSGQMLEDFRKGFGSLPMVY